MYVVDARFVLVYLLLAHHAAAGDRTHVRTHVGTHRLRIIPRVVQRC